MIGQFKFQARQLYVRKRIPFKAGHTYIAGIKAFPSPRVVSNATQVNTFHRRAFTVKTDTSVDNVSSISPLSFATCSVLHLAWTKNPRL